ncbi:3-oxo-5-alpha-steroid 4-dehydrogenase 1 [Entamoeba marina]
MPIAIMFLSILFNIVDAYTHAGWLFFYHPDNYYDNWLSYPMFWIGLVLFISGMAINIHSDHIIRNLRKPGEQGHKLPVGGLFDYVTSANYFGELLEWFGYTVLTCSPGALVFFWWTFANLCPRAKSIHKKYRESFKDQVGDRKILIPFIY